MNIVNYGLNLCIKLKNWRNQVCTLFVQMCIRKRNSLDFRLLEISPLGFVIELVAFGSHSINLLKFSIKIRTVIKTRFIAHF